MTDKAWKACERRVAAYIGGGAKRVPITGRQRGDKPDIEHKWLSVEVKYKQKMPKWLHDAMDQAKQSKRGRQMPIVILCEAGVNTGDCYAVIPLSEVKERWL